MGRLHRRWSLASCCFRSWVAHYRFEAVTHQLVMWLMDVPSEEARKAVICRTGSNGCWWAVMRTTTPRFICQRLMSATHGNDSSDRIREPFSGKSALVLGIAQQLSKSGQAIRFGKPLATSWTGIRTRRLPQPLIDDDVRSSGTSSASTRISRSLPACSPATANAAVGAGDVLAGSGFDTMRRQISG